MNMNTLQINRRLLACVASCLTLLMASCASPVVEEANQLARLGQHEVAVERLEQALAQNPDDRQLRMAMLKQRDLAVNALSLQADAAKTSGKLADVQSIQQRMQAIAPQHPRAVSLKLDVDRIKRMERLMGDAQAAFDAGSFERAEASLRVLLSEDRGNAAARALLSRIEEMRESQTRQNTTLKLATAQKSITLEFREAQLKNVFESLARAADVNFVFDKDVRGDAKVTIFLRNTTVDEALRVILNTQQLSSKLLNDNTVLVFPATQQKMRDVLDTVTKTFYLTNADPKQAQALVRTVAKTRDIFIDERLSLLVVRDTPEVVRLIERLIQGIDLPDPEVMLELEVMEVSSKKLDSLGVSWPETASYGVPDSTAAISTLSGLRWSVANPLALATIRATRGATNLLANPKVRARNREKAKILLGEKLPIFTTTSTANVGVSASVSYLDVGLKLEVEPLVQLDNDVTIKVALEVSSITDKVLGPQGSIAYQVGTRQASTTLRLKDGETQILAGLINDNESRSSAGIPGLHDLPLAGRLFGLTTDTHDKTEVVLLITPRIVRNLVQPSGAASPMPSGTESQPGANPMLLKQGKASSVPSGLSGAPSQARARPQDSRPGAGQSHAQAITGPEEVMAGASFQVAVHNRSTQPMSTTLSVDTSVLSIEAQGGQSGSLSITVPPQGVQSVMLRARPEVTLSDTVVSVDNGGEPLRVRVRNPNTPDPDAAQQPLAEPPIETDPNPNPNPNPNDPPAIDR